MDSPASSHSNVTDWKWY